MQWISRALYAVGCTSAILALSGCGASTASSNSGSSSGSNPSTASITASQLAASATSAYTFLDNRMDAYGSGSTLRLAPSYVNTTAFNVGDVAYIYDTDVMLIALLKRGTADDLTRAQVLGNALVYAQQHDPIGDGRIRNSYHTNPFITTTNAVNLNDTGSYTGNLAWTGLALVQLYHATGVSSYLTAATSLASYLNSNAYSTTGQGGYTAGVSASGTTLTYKATEHQIDLYAFFTLLASATGDSTYTTEAQHAYTELMAMWNSTGGYYYTGTGSDGVTLNINDDPTPEDIQSWSFLATGLSSHQQSIDWAISNLSVSTGGFSGIAFDTGDYGTGVWFEGTAHVAAALAKRNASGDAAASNTLLADIYNAQINGTNSDGLGIIAASINGLEADGSATYYQALHVGSTAWFCLAANAANPFTF